MKNKLTFFSTVNQAFWNIPEVLVPEIFKYLSSDELLDVIKMHHFATPDTPDKKNSVILYENKIRELSRQALIVLVSRYLNEEDFLNQRRGFLLLPSETFLKDSPGYASKVDIFTKALYDSMRHTNGKYPYKIHALRYLAAIRGKPMNVDFQSDVAALLRRMRKTSYVDYSVEVELLLPFFTEEDVQHLTQICWNQSHELSTRVNYTEKSEQRVLTSSTSLAVDLFSVEEIIKLEGLLNKSPEHINIKNILNIKKKDRRLFNIDEVKEIQKILEDANEIELSAKVVPYAQSLLEKQCTKYLDVFNRYTLAHKDFDYWMLKDIENYLHIKSISDGLEKFALKSSEETRKIVLRYIFERIQSIDAYYDIPFNYFYLIRQFGRDNPDLIKHLYDFAIRKMTAIPSQEQDWQYGLSIIGNIVDFLEPQQTQECFDLVWIMVAPQTTLPQTMSQLVFNFYTSVTSLFGAANIPQEGGRPLDSLTFMIVSSFWKAAMNQLSDAEINKIIERMFSIFEARNAAWMQLVLEESPDAMRSLIEKVAETLKPEQVNTLFERIKHELQSDKIDNKCMALHIALAFKDKLSLENLQYVFQNLKKMLHTPNISDFFHANDLTLLNTLIKMMPLFGKHQWVDAELFEPVFQQYAKIVTIRFEGGIDWRDRLRETFKQLFFMLNQYSQDAEKDLLPKYLVLLNSETSNPYQRIIALESLLQLVLDHKIKHVEVVPGTSTVSKIAQQIFPISELVLTPVKQDEKKGPSVK